MRLVSISFMLSLSTSLAFAVPPVPTCATEVGELAPATKHRQTLRYLQATPASNAWLKSGECLVSPNRAFVAVMQTDGQLVVYDINRPGTHEWAAGTDGHPGASLILNKSGNIQIYSAGGVTEKRSASAVDYIGDSKKRLWSSNVSTKPFLNYYLAMQEDGNLVVYRGKPDYWVDFWTWSWRTGPSGKPDPQRQCSELCTWDQTVGMQCQYPCR